MAGGGSATARMAMGRGPRLRAPRRGRRSLSCREFDANGSPVDRGQPGLAGRAVPFRPTPALTYTSTDPSFEFRLASAVGPMSWIPTESLDKPVAIKWHGNHPRSSRPQAWTARGARDAGQRHHKSRVQYRPLKFAYIFLRYS